LSTTATVLSATVSGIQMAWAAPQPYELDAVEDSSTEEPMSMLNLWMASVSLVNDVQWPPMPCCVGPNCFLSKWPFIPSRTCMQCRKNVR